MHACFLFSLKYEVPLVTQLFIHIFAAPPLFKYDLKNFTVKDTASFVFRYHYNVADSRLHQHIEKGNRDGLYVSSVASSANFWALIMDAGTGFCSRVYELSQVFLHKVHYDLFLSLCHSLHHSIS